MKSYTVVITEILRREVEVEAECAADAMIRVNDEYRRGDHVLDASDFMDVEFKAKRTARSRDFAR